MIEDLFTKPPPYGRTIDWLGQQMVTQLLLFAQIHRDSFCASPVSRADERAVGPDLAVRRSSKVELLGELRDALQARVLATLPEMCRQLGNGQFNPSGLEIEMVAHGDGAFFVEHRDRLAGPGYGSRLISAICYFHRLPKSFAGGALRIYPIAGSKKSSAFVEIEPANDTLVFFSSLFPHEVLPVSCPSGHFEDSRFAIKIHC
jgi:SM-20-related protein